jgi:hypothetical protein
MVNNSIKLAFTLFLCSTSIAQAMKQEEFENDNSSFTLVVHQDEIDSEEEGSEKTGKILCTLDQLTKSLTKTPNIKTVIFDRSLLFYETEGLHVLDSMIKGEELINQAIQLFPTLSLKKVEFGHNFPINQEQFKCLQDIEVIENLRVKECEWWNFPEFFSQGNWKKITIQPMKDSWTTSFSTAELSKPFLKFLQNIKETFKEKITPHEFQNDPELPKKIRNKKLQEPVESMMSSCESPLESKLRLMMQNPLQNPRELLCNPINPFTSTFNPISRKIDFNQDEEVFLPEAFVVGKESPMGITNYFKVHDPIYGKLTYTVESKYSCEEPFNVMQNFLSQRLHNLKITTNDQVIILEKPEKITQEEEIFVQEAFEQFLKENITSKVNEQN